MDSIQKNALLRMQEILAEWCENKGSCRLWTRAKGTHGYGVIGIPGTNRTITTHRLAWILTNGEIPGSLLVLHDCGNKLCTNPSHLHLGTHADNLREAHAKKERVCGESALQTKVVSYVAKCSGVAFKLGAAHKKGIPDLLIISPNGQKLFLELKKPGGVLTPTQVYMHQKLIAMQHAVTVAYSFEEARAIIDSLWELT